MSVPRWIDQHALLLLHDESLATHGGLAGVRDQGLFESALARPRNLLAYQPDVSIHQLAAAYGYGLARNHPFTDGNKRAALLAVGLFLALNGHRLRASQIDAYNAIMALAGGLMDEAELAQWLVANSLEQ